MTATATNEDDLTPTLAAARAGKCEATIRRWVRSGRLPARREPLTDKLLIRAADVDALTAFALVVPDRPTAAPATDVTADPEASDE